MWRDTTHFDSEDDYRTGCRNLSHCQQQQSYSGLHWTGRSNSTYFWRLLMFCSFRLERMSYWEKIPESHDNVPLGAKFHFKTKDWDFLKASSLAHSFKVTNIEYWHTVKTKSKSYHARNTKPFMSGWLLVILSFLQGIFRVQKQYTCFWQWSLISNCIASS